MSFTTARPMLASAVRQLHQTAVRSFSTAPVVCSKVLSPLNKTSLARQQRANKGLVKGGKRGKGKQTMTLEEASRVLAAWSPATPNAAYEINVTTKPSGTIQLNALRGRVFLPHSCASATKQSTLVVFASGQAAQAAREAGADVVGGQELIDDILAGNVNPDKLITTTEMFALFQRNPTLARTLGPRGLMPSAKRGTVTDDIVQAVKEARGGLDWKGDNKGIVRAAIGRLHFQPEQLADNVHTLLASVADIAQGGNGSVNGVPPHVKRPAITRVLISSTQGPGIELSDA